jgi:aspartyl/glutamyl-tRNA(Asn/Gln) amidotransferase C subunit
MTDIALAHLASLAALELDDPAEAAALEKDLASIVGYVELLRAVPTDDVPPMTTVAAPAPRLALRADEPRAELSHEEALAGAPRANDEGFVVPTFVGTG